MLLMKMSSTSLVSIIIPTFNSEKTLAKCLESVRNQTYEKIEVVIVDNCSEDKTIEIAKAYGSKLIQASAGMAESRNIGAKTASGEFIFSIDSDMELSTAVIEECIKAVKKGHDAVIIPEISVGEGFWARCRSLESECYIGDEFVEAARFFRRDVFDAVGGYDPDLLFGEDWDLHLRVKKGGYKIGRAISLIKHQEDKLSLWELMKKKFEYGKTLENYKRKHPGEFKKQAMFIRPAFVRNWKKLAKDPIHALGIFFMKICEAGSCWVGYLINEIFFLDTLRK